MGVSMNIIMAVLINRKWREEQTKILQEKDEEESKALQELRDAASKELDDWYNHHEDTLKHAKDSNRYC